MGARPATSVLVDRVIHRPNRSTVVIVKDHPDDHLAEKSGRMGAAEKIATPTA